MNERDSEFIAGLFLEKGYTLADSPDDADIVLFNTCSVREHAEHRAISNMGALLKIAHRKPITDKRKPKIFGIVGCMAQAMGNKLFQRLPGLDMVCGTGEIAKLPELAQKAQEKKILATGNADKFILSRSPYYREKKDHAYVSIMRGCNNFCSYCIVPHVRGKERSRPVPDIVNEVKDIVANGIRNITLLGQNVNSYKTHDTRHKTHVFGFIDLLKEINNIDGVEKISFMTSHPKDAGIELFEAMRDLDKINRHLHLPLQSGSDRILKLMNRGYTRKKYLSLVKKAREIVPDLRLTTDIIIGFPTETGKDFNDTLSLMKEVEFNLAYIFKYSPRAGTKAARLKDDVPEATKSQRHKTLLDLQRGLYEKNNHIFINR